MAGRPWFRPKKYGWGFTPVSWQGWALTVGYVALVFGLSSTLAAGQPWIFGTLFALATVVFIVVAFLTRGA